MKQLIKMYVMAAVIVFGWSLQPETAAAESVRATRTVRLMSRPGEKSRVLKRVPSGRSMKVLSRKGRWIKVRVGSQAGWVTRTSVREMGEPKARSARKTRRRAFVDGRSKRRGWSDGAPEDRIGADAIEDDFDEEEDEPRAKKKRSSAKKKRASAEDDEDWGDEDEDEGEGEDDEGEDEGEGGEEADEETVVVTSSETEVMARPSSKADTAFYAEEGDKLYEIGRSESGKWIEVENDQGETGWVKAKHVKENSPFEYKRMGYAANGGLGYTAMGMTFVSDGTGNLANYQMTSAAASLVVGADMTYAGGSDTRLLGVDLQYRGSRATPGIRYDDGAGNVADIGFTMHEIDIGGSYGYNFRRSDGLAAYARAGYHYGQFKIHDVEQTDTINIARLPSELLQGFTVGGKVAAPRLTDKIGGSVEAAYLMGGKRTQTVGLEDGATSRVAAIWGVASLVYQWKPDMQLVGGYRYFQSNTDWAGAAEGSMRGHDATVAKRKDVVHTVSVGLGKAF